jgi:hypothetical protein
MQGRRHELQRTDSSRVIPYDWSRDSSVSIVTNLPAGPPEELRFDCRQGYANFSSPKRPVWFWCLLSNGMSVAISP